MNRRYAILEAPSTLGLKSDGVERLGERLLDLGLASRIGARHAGTVAVPPRTHERDPASGVLNLGAIAEFSPQLADAVGHVIDRTEFPVVLGGDCTILLGSMLALRRRGRYGLLFVDGNADFFQPEAEPNGEGASMDLAWVTGYGPAALSDIEHRMPLVRPEDTVAFGYRDHADQKESGSQPLAKEVLDLDLPNIRAIGVEEAVRRALERLTGDELGGFFIHLDADVLDDAIMPAVDFRIPGGLSVEDVRTLLRFALKSCKAVGLEVTIYNPDLDEDGAAAATLCDLLAASLVR